MNMIVAYIRPIMQDDVVERLRALEVPGASLTEINGFGLEADPNSPNKSYGPQVSPYADMIKLEVVCPAERTDELAEAVARTARTGRRGDGKVFVLPIDRGIDIRTQTWISTEDAADAP